MYCRVVMDFMPPGTLERRLRQARRARVAELVAVGRTTQDATTQADAEFEHYDHRQYDDRGWVRIPGLELDDASSS